MGDSGSLLSASNEEIALRDAVLALVIEQIRAEAVIPMGAPEFSGSAGGFEYFFEAEDDLLHLGVARAGRPITVEEAQEVAAFLLRGIPAGLIWLKPGDTSHHFYLGQDELLRTGSPPRNPENK